MKKSDPPRTLRIANCRVRSLTWENLLIAMNRNVAPVATHATATTMNRTATMNLFGWLAGSSDAPAKVSIIITASAIPSEFNAAC